MCLNAGNFRLLGISRIDQVTRQCHPEQGGVGRCSPRRASRGPQNTKPCSAESIWKQKMWDRPLIESDKAVVSAAYSDPINRARLNAVTSPHAGHWLST